MWIAFVVILAANGAIYTSNAPKTFPSQQECVEANQKVEEVLMKNAAASKETFAYHFDCMEVTDKAFKKPGLDA